jgi:hypothetical protein
MPRPTWKRHRKRHASIGAFTAGTLTALCLVGCASSPSHSPSAMGAETFRGKRSPLSESEASANCTGLKTAMQTHANEIKAARARMAEELKTPAPSLDRMSRRASGEEGGGTVAYDQIKAERHVMAAINARLTDKGCAAIDIEQTITATAAPTSKPCTAALLKPDKGRQPDPATANKCS